MGSMAAEERARRSDAERNRQRLLEAAAAVFAEHGLDAGVGEVAARAGVGRGTLFRNFPTKQDLIAAIVVDRMRQAIENGRKLLDAGDDAAAVFTFIREVIQRQRENRALMEAVADEFLANQEIRDVHAGFIALIGDLLEHGKRAGSVRPDVSAVDVLMLVKGVCSAASAIEVSDDVLNRHTALVLGAIATPQYSIPLTGPAPTLADLEPTPTSSPAPAAGVRG